MAMAQDFGLHDGFVVPIYGANGDQSCVTMGGRNKDHHPLSRNALQLLSLYAHNRARTLLAGAKPQPGPANALTAREKECLRWIALGKTDQDMAEILGLSTHGVNALVRRVARRLNAAHRAHAVAIALSNGQLRL